MVDTIATPPDPPLRSNPTTFAERREAWLLWEEGGLVPGLNATIEAFNPLISRYEELLGIANLVGYWADQTGPASPPMAVLHDFTVSGQYEVYYLVNPTSDITTDVPGVSTKWVLGKSEAPTRFAPVAELSTGAASYTFTSRVTEFRELEFLVRGASPSETATMNVGLYDGTSWYIIDTAAGPSSAAGDAWTGSVRVRNRGEKVAELICNLALSGSSGQIASPEVKRLFRSPNGVQGVRFSLNTGNFDAGVIIPRGIGAPAS